MLLLAHYYVFNNIDHWTSVIECHHVIYFVYSYLSKTLIENIYDCSKSTILPIYSYCHVWFKETEKLFFNGHIFYNTLHIRIEIVWRTSNMASKLSIKRKLFSSAKWKRRRRQKKEFMEEQWKALLSQLLSENPGEKASVNAPQDIFAVN